MIVPLEFLRMTFTAQSMEEAITVLDICYNMAMQNIANDLRDRTVEIIDRYLEIKYKEEDQKKYAMLWRKQEAELFDSNMIYIESKDKIERLYSKAKQGIAIRFDTLLSDKNTPPTQKLD